MDETAILNLVTNLITIQRDIREEKGKRKWVRIVCIIIICTRTKPAILVLFLVTNLIVILQWGNKGGEGEGKGEVG